jgi:hypothetical protein
MSWPAPIARLDKVRDHPGEKRKKHHDHDRFHTSAPSLQLRRCCDFIRFCIPSRGRDLRQHHAWMDPLHPAMLAQIGSPSAGAWSELSTRLCPPSAEAAGAFVQFRRAPDLIVDEHSPCRRRPFRRQPIAIHQRREAVGHNGSPTGSRAQSALSFAGLPRGQRPRPRGGSPKPRPRRARSVAKRASSVGDSCQGLQGLGRRLQRAASPPIIARRPVDSPDVFMIGSR